MNVDAPTVLIAGLLVLSVALAGCSGVTNDADGTTTGEELTATTTVGPTTKKPTTDSHATTRQTTEEFEPGDNLLGVEEFNESEVWDNESRRTTFRNLTAPQQSVFLEALNCDCNVNQNVFRHQDDDRVRWVEYESDWYYLRVTIV